MSYRPLAKSEPLEGSAHGPAGPSESNYFPNLAAYFAGSTGSAVVVTTGVPCATGMASVPAVLNADVIPSDNLLIMLFSLGGAADIVLRRVVADAKRS